MKLQAFGVHSPDGTFTCLGIDQVAEKSAQTAFEKLCVTVTKLSGASTDFLKKFMVSVKSTMSDSAYTEIKFNRLVEAYRSEVIPEIVHNFAGMADEEKEQISSLSQFFCQLHVLSNYTKVVLKSLLEHEMAVTSVQKLEEPSVFTVVKLVSQLFGTRGAGMHGILTAWKCWCREKRIARQTFDSFVGNRFNIVFVIASRVFFHRHELIRFCEEVESKKPELKRLRQMLKTPMISAHLHLLGFSDQLITGPLWRLAEISKHILDTCHYSLQLITWLEECKQFPGSFFDGICPVPSLQVNNPTTSVALFQALVAANPSQFGLQAAALVATSSVEYFKRAFTDFLPGGRYCDEADNIRETTTSAPGTNRAVESVFGLVSHLFNTKPNMRVDVRTAFTMIQKNHTIEWLKTLTEDVRSSILTEARASVSQLAGDAAARQVEIDKVVLQKIREKNQAAAAKTAKQASKRRSCIDEIVRIGFWKTDIDNDQGLSALKTLKLKRDAVISQLNFRKIVIEQTAPSTKFFNVTFNQSPVPFAELLDRLRFLQRNDHSVGDVLLRGEIIGKSINHFNGAMRSAVVRDVCTAEDGHTAVDMQYDDDHSFSSISLREFQSAVSNGTIAFI
uniref:Uncharacterized protein n=1 Tax=Caenorhabditis japonica TaxID=281687 RepID=A0A8R1E442_CAEJA